MYQRFQVLFHSLSGVLFAFPSRYWFTIGQSVVFSLEDETPCSDKVLVLRPTRFHFKDPFAYGAITHYGLHFPERSAKNHEVRANPRSLATTKGISVDFFSLRVLRCFSSPGSPLAPMDSVQDT